MDILSLPVLQADHRIAYGADPAQFGDLWLPDNPLPHPLPLVVFFHGGWWKSKYDLGYAGRLCQALKKAGVICWSVEYRRVGETGGGWPATFQDAAAGFNYVATLAKTYPIDLSRVITMGHSAGGHLAFWIAGRHHIESHSDIYPQPSTVRLAGAVALAGAVDLRLTIDLSGYFTFAHDKHEVYRLMGGHPVDLPERYKAGNPGDLLPFQVPQVLIQGTEDDQIPAELPGRWANMAQRMGETAIVHRIPAANHFDLVDPESTSYPVVLDAVRKLLLP